MDFNTAITIILAALGVLLTALAIMVGVAAVWGYGSIKEEARKIASEIATQVSTQTADKTLAEYFEERSLSDRIRQVMPPATVPPGSRPITEPIESDEGQHTGKGKEDAINAAEASSKPE
jgi:hypothetical protein